MFLLISFSDQLDSLPDSTTLYSTSNDNDTTNSLHTPVMRSSILLTAALAVGVLSLPQPNRKGNLVTEVDVIVKTVVVTVTAEPTTPPTFEEQGRQVRPAVAPQPTRSRLQPPFASSRVRPTPTPIRPPFWLPPGSAAPVRASPSPIRPPFWSPPGSASTTPLRASPSPIRPPFASPPGSSSPVPTRASPTPIRPPFAGQSSSSGSVAPSSQAPASSGTASSSTAPAPSASPPSGNVDHISGVSQAYLSSGADYQAAVLYHHNAARANHGAQPLTWDTACEANARIAAERCTFAHYVPTGANQGQNLFTVSGDAFNVTAGITESWYKSELPPMMPYFGDADLPDEIFHQVGHLTQLVWKATTGVGCVSIDCGDNMVVGSDTSSPLNKYTVCNYAPAGNVAGRYAINVQAPISLTDLGSWAD